MNQQTTLLPRIALLGCALLLIGHRPARADVWAITGAAVETMGKAGRIESAAIVIRDSRIEAIGPLGSVDIPDTARIVDLPGRTILPGIIDPYHVVRLPGLTTAAPTRTIVIRGRTIVVPSGSAPTMTFAKVADSLVPHDLHLRPLARSGITHANLTAAGYGVAALARVTPNEPGRIVARLDGPLYVPVTNDPQVLSLIRSGLGGSSRSRPMPPGGSAGRSSEGRPMAGGQASRGSSSASAAIAAALWKEVSEGKRRLIANANNPAAIVHLFELLKGHKNVKLTVVASGENLFQVLDQVKQHNASLILQPSIEVVPNSNDRVCIPREAHEAGIPFALSMSLSSSELDASQDAPLLRIAYLVKCGLPRDAALAALTTRPAELLGLEPTHGSLEVNKLANLLVFDRDPLDPASRLERVVVEGETIHEN